MLSQYNYLVFLFNTVIVVLHYFICIFLFQIKEEIYRRKSLPEKSKERKKYIKSNYIPFDISVYYLNVRFIFLY